MPTENIFVFGSNLAGIHGAGAALRAKQAYGARQGIGIGRFGNSYAIPTKDNNIRTLPLHVIVSHIKDFLVYAEEHLDLDFYVTKIGCGLAGYQDFQIAPHFRTYLDNLVFDSGWTNWLGEKYPRYYTGEL